MRILKKILVILIILSVVNLRANVFAEEGDLLPKLNLEASGSLDVYSKYLWRGFTLDTDPVVQPGFNLSGYGITFSYWGSWDFDNNDSIDGDEIDYVIDYTKELDQFSVSIGHIYYEFPGTDTFSKEWYVGVGFSGLLLSPSLTYYIDYGDEGQGSADGEYLALEGSHSISLIDDLGITLDLSGRVAYNKELFIVGEGGDALIAGALSIPLTEILTMSPSVNYAVPFGDLDEKSDGNQRDRFYYGVSFGYEF